MTLLTDLSFTRPALMFPAGSQPVGTSEDAADSIAADDLNDRRYAVLVMFADAKLEGMTADEVVERMGCGHPGDTNTWAPRVTELLQLELLDRLDGKSGRQYLRRGARSGSTAFVHVINQKGRRYAR